MGLRWGLLSTARINRALVTGARLTEAAEVVAVGSRSGRRARGHASELGLRDARTHGSYAALLEDPAVEAVYVALPNGLHVEWSIRALEAGKHVLCEKPLTRRAAEAERAFAVARDRGLVLAEAFMWRHHPQARRLRELVAEGAIGRLRNIRATFGFHLRGSDPRLAAGLDGGALMDVGCYCVSGARMLAGEPLKVTAQQIQGGDGVDVGFVGTLSFPDDVLATFDCGFDVAGRDDLEVMGDGASLFLDDPWHSRRPVIEVRRPDGSVERVEVRTADPYACELEDFARAVRGEAPHPLGEADALGQARAIEALYAAAETGRAVEVAR